MSTRESADDNRECYYSGKTLLEVAKYEKHFILKLNFIFKRFLKVFFAPLINFFSRRKGYCLKRLLLSEDSKSVYK